MIRVSPAQLILVYLCLILCAVLVVWLGSDLLRKRRERLARKHKILCSICGAVYEDRGEHALSKCPECESMNEREKIRDI